LSFQLAQTLSNSIVVFGPSNCLQNLDSHEEFLDLSVQKLRDILDSLQLLTVNCILHHVVSDLAGLLLEFVCAEAEVELSLGCHVLEFLDELEGDGEEEEGSQAQQDAEDGGEKRNLAEDCFSQSQFAELEVEVFVLKLEGFSFADSQIAWHCP
jgi:hypothetical protein